MEQYVALDVSLKEISVCIIDSKGAVVFERKTAAEPATLVELIRGKAPQVVRVGLETCSTSPWLFHALTSAGLPVVCMDARHAHAVLSMRPMKSDRSDARGLADMPRMGWYREVHAKSITSHEHRTMLGVGSAPSKGLTPPACAISASTKAGASSTPHRSNSAILSVPRSRPAAATANWRPYGCATSIEIPARFIFERARLVRIVML